MGAGSRQVAPSRPPRSLVTFWALSLPEGALGRATLSTRATEWTVDDTRSLEWIGRIGRAGGLDLSETLGRLADGSVWAALLLGDAVAACGWVSTGPTLVGEISRWFTPGPGEAYVWDCRTLPPFHGQGHYPRLLGAIARELARSGFGKVWIGVEWTNWRSIQGIARAGFQPVGAVVALTRGGHATHQIVPNDAASPALSAALRRALSLRAALPTTGRQALVASAGRSQPSVHDGEGEQGSGRPGRLWLFTADDASLERPGARPLDPDERQAA